MSYEEDLKILHEKYGATAEPSSTRVVPPSFDIGKAPEEQEEIPDKYKQLGEGLDPFAPIREKTGVNALITGVEKFMASLPQVAGGIMMEVGERAEDTSSLIQTTLNPILTMKPFMKWLAKGTEIDEKVAQLGKKWIDQNQAYIKENYPEQETAYKRFAETLGQGAGSLALALGLSYATKNPNVAGAAFGIMAKSRAYTEARKGGMSPEDASAVSTSVGIGEAILESWGLQQFLKVYSTPLKGALTRMASEAIQEASQTISESTIMTTTGAREFEGIMPIVQEAAMSAVVGGILGGGSSAIQEVASRKLQKNNIPMDVADEVGESIKNKIPEALGGILTPGLTIKLQYDPLKQKGTVKSRIKKATDLTTGEYLELNQKQALRRFFQRQQAASREGYRAGKKEGKGIGAEKLQAYKQKMAEAKTEQERINLRIKLRAEQKASQEGYRFGYKEKSEIIRNRDKVTRLVKAINVFKKTKLPEDYREKVDELLSPYDLKKRSKKVLHEREERKKYLERKEMGEFFYIPKEILTTTFKKPLNDMTIEELGEVHDKAKILVHLGKYKQKLIVRQEVRELQKITDFLAKEIIKNTPKPKVPFSDKYLTPSERRSKGFLGKKKEKITGTMDKVFGMLKKPEAIIEGLDGYRECGSVWYETFYPIKKAEDRELLRSHKIYNTIQEAMDKSKIDFRAAHEEQDVIDGSALTKTEQMAVYANSLNPDNRYRLRVGQGWSEEKIDNIVDNLTSTERKFVNGMMGIVQSQWKGIARVGKKLLGTTPKAVENYWPIYTDRDFSDQQLIRERERDLFKNIIRKAYVSRGFTITRKGGTDPISLDFFKVFTDHIDKTDHFITHAIPVRDVQRILTTPKMRTAIKSAKGEAEYLELRGWLRHVAAPYQTPTNILERAAAGLRHNSTMAALGAKVSVSLKQAGSFSQTINRLGVKDATEGITAFLQNPKEIPKIQEFIYSKSPQMKYRRENYDRELRDLIHKNLGQKGKFALDKHKFLFHLVSTVDKTATLPTWAGAYASASKKYKGNEKAMVEYADMIVRRTQPTGSPKDLPSIMRGSEFQKLFTMFYSHFSNAYNESARTYGMLKQGKISKSDAMVSYMWLTVVPALFAGVVSGKLLKKEPVSKKAATVGKEIIGYGSALFPIVGSIVGSLVNKYPYSATPAEAFPEALVAFGRSKSFGKKLKHGTKAAGYLFGLPTPQILITGEGAYDLLTGETGNPMRLFLSKWQLGEEDGKKRESITYDFNKSLKEVKTKNKPHKNPFLR